MTTAEATVTAAAIRYHVGVVPGAPFYSISLGGVSFPSLTYAPSVVDPQTGSSAQTIGREGAVVELTDGDVRNIKTAIENRVVRIMSQPGEPLQGRVWHKKGSRYRPDKRDRPLGDFVYLRLMTEQEQARPIPISKAVSVRDDADTADGSEQRRRERRQNVKAPPHELEG